jgi:hypothetical protein
MKRKIILTSTRDNLCVLLSEIPSVGYLQRLGDVLPTFDNLVELRQAQRSGPRIRELVSGVTLG